MEGFYPLLAAAATIAVIIGANWYVLLRPERTARHGRTRTQREEQS